MKIKLQRNQTVRSVLCDILKTLALNLKGTRETLKTFKRKARGSDQQARPLKPQHAQWDARGQG